MVRIRVDFVMHGAALDAAEVQVRFVVDAPHITGDEGAIDIRGQRSVRVQVNDWRSASVVGLLPAWIDSERTFLQAPVDPYGDVSVQFAIRSLHLDGVGQVEHVSMASGRSSMSQMVLTQGPAATIT